MKIPLTPYERSLLARAEAGSLPAPSCRTERELRALQTLISVGHLTPQQTNGRVNAA